MRRRRDQLRPPRERTRLDRKDRLRAAAVALLALLVAGLTAWGVRPPDADDPVARAESSRVDLAGGLAGQVAAVFTELRRQAVVLAAGGAGGPQLPAPREGGLPRWYWVTDESGEVTSTSPAAGALLGRARPVRERSRVVKVPAAVGSVTRDALLVADVLLVHARTPGGDVLTMAVPAAAAGVNVEPTVVGGSRVALLGPDGTVAAGRGRRPADASLTGAVRGGSRAGPARYAGEGGSRRLAGVAPVADGWVVVAEGGVPAPGARAARTALLRSGAALALLTTLAALLIGRAAVRRTARRGDAVQQALLTVTGHELRTPLTIIIGSTRTLISRWDRLEESARKEMATGVGRQAKTLDRLVERLLHAGRLAAGQASELSVRPVDVAAIAATVVDDLRRLAPLHELSVVGLPGAPPAAADERALTQVLEHLLDNAVKYSPDGGAVEVSVAPEGRRSKRVRVTVRDEGVGLPSDTSRLFRAFGQSQDVNTRTTDEGGVGVGLSIVKDLVTAMGGSVHAERLDRGSAFVVLLPASQD